MADLGIKFQPQRQFVVFDGNYLLHRVLRSPRMLGFATTDGVPTGGIYGFLRSFRAAVTAVKGFHRCVVVFDGGSSVRRTQLYPGYRVREIDETPLQPGAAGVTLQSPLDAGLELAEIDPKRAKRERRAAAQDGISYLDLFRHQVRLVYGWLRFMGINMLRFKQREADDLIYQLVRLAQADGLRSIIVSNDRDFYQLLSDTVHVYRPPSGLGEDGDYLTPEAFRTRFGFSPRRCLLYRALSGDPSDKVKGVPRVGEKTAAAIVQQVKHARDLPRWCQKHAADGGRLNFKAAGTEDAQVIVARNLRLFDLRRESFTESEMARMQTVYRRRLPRDKEQLLELATRLQLDTIVHHLGQWLRPFYWQK
jgi:5'-3' exonuclease